MMRRAFTVVCACVAFWAVVGGLVMAGQPAHIPASPLHTVIST